MLRGCGASGVASLGPSSLAALASSVLSPLGFRGLENLSEGTWQKLGQRCIATGAQAVPATQLQSASSTSGAAATSTTATTSSNTDDGSELPVNFTLRPSVLSPLFPSWDRARRISQRRDHLLGLLRSHEVLASSFEAKNPLVLARKVRKRVEGIQHTTIQLRQLLDEHVVPTCPAPEYAAAYCATLEANAATMDPSANDFARVQRGEVSPWTHYATYFHDNYRNAPRLQPLEVIFSKPDPADVVRQLQAGDVLGSARGAAGATSRASTGGLPPGVIGPHIDVAGVTHTAGKRKTSTAALDLVPGTGQVSVNGLPVATYFRDMDVRKHALEPLMMTGSETKYNISVRVRGGGSSSQAQAVRTAVARALCVQQPALAAQLADLTRWDGRVVERKKVGREKARRGFTWVKR